MTTIIPLAERTRQYHIKILGRTLEHLGVQMYKRRDVAIAELVANSWDAGASNVWITVPKSPEHHLDEVITVIDDGCGMSDDEVETAYLVIGRNRRKSNDNQNDDGSNAAPTMVDDSDGGDMLTRPVMGKKGIGKLAGFGIASSMGITTWRDGIATHFTLDVDRLKTSAGHVADERIDAVVAPVTDDLVTPHGTKIVLSRLRHKTPLDIDMLHQSLGRRFSRRVLGQMTIRINDELVTEPVLPLDKRFPGEGMIRTELSDGHLVRYWYGYATETIKSPQMRGFTIQVHGKTAQAPPYFFGVEGTASGQHATRYVTGTIEADWLDDSVDEDNDPISTDRQELDWEDEHLASLKKWGDELTRKILREWVQRRGEHMENLVLENDDLRTRIDRLDRPSQKQVRKYLRDLGQADPNPERALLLADQIVRAFEYRHFHDVIEEIDAASTDPDKLNVLLSHLADWKVLESRAILEIVKGRLDIIEKFRQMLISDAPETASKRNPDNLHDLLGRYPWLLNPEWQVLTEETTISKHLRELNAEAVGEVEGRQRYDFIALTDQQQLVIVEIKRTDHAITFDELTRLDTYKQSLSKAHSDIYVLMVGGGGVDVNKNYREYWETRPDGAILSWSVIYDRVRRYFEHYRAVLEGDVQHPYFHAATMEVANTREVLRMESAHRTTIERDAGLGPQYIDLGSEPSEPGV